MVPESLRENQPYQQRVLSAHTQPWITIPANFSRYGFHYNSFLQRSDHSGCIEYVVQMAIDDTRNLLYTLSSKSTIRTFHLKPNNGLDLAITQTISYTFSNVRHMVSRTDLIDINTPIVSISPIPANEASKLHLMATTSTGCRLFLSATSSFGWTTSESGAPTSMQVQHVKFPPPDSSKQPSQKSPSQSALYQANEAIDTS